MATSAKAQKVTIVSDAALETAGALDFATLMRLAHLAHEREIRLLRADYGFSPRSDRGQRAPIGGPGSAIVTAPSAPTGGLSAIVTAPSLVPPDGDGASLCTSRSWGRTNTDQPPGNAFQLDPAEMGKQSSKRLAQAMQQCCHNDSEADGDDAAERGLNLCCGTAKRRLRQGNLEFSHDVRSSFTKNRLERFLQGPFDVLMNCLVVASAVSLSVELEIRGASLGRKLGAPDDGSLISENNAFRIAEHVVNAVFVFELMSRLWLLGRSFFFDRATRRVKSFNCMDLFIVCTCTFDLYVMPTVRVRAGDGTGDLSSLRLLRLLRLTRTLRVLRVMTAFSKLRILLNTTASSFMSLFWAMILMFLFVYGSAVFLCQMLQPSVADPSLSMDLRKWIFRYYGSASRSFWTLFEITFSGGWPSYARRLIEEVHWTFALFFAAYVWIVVFAVTRIITALFLKDTMQVADEDQEMMLRAQLVKKEQYTRKLRELFAIADDSGDGTISLEEFKEVAKLSKVQLYFNALDLQIPEVCELFEMLDNGDGSVSYDEFCAGILRLKGHARAMDVVSTMRDCRAILNKCTELERRVDALAMALCGCMPSDAALTPTVSHRKSGGSKRAFHVQRSI